MKQVERVPDLRSQIYERLRIAIRGGEYAPGTRLSLHQDKDERDFSAPIVSVSLACRLSFCSVAPAVASAHTAYRLHTATSSSGVVSRACAITVCCP